MTIVNRSMRLASRVDALAVRLSEGDPQKTELRSRIAALDNECGCTMAGIFLAVAVGLAAVYFVMAGGPSFSSGLLAGGFIFGAAIVGKATGLGVAQLRLLLLRRLLTTRLARVD